MRNRSRHFQESLKILKGLGGGGGGERERISENELDLFRLTYVQRKNKPQDKGGK